MFGRFLELATATQDISTSVLFYERLGLRQLLTGDAYAYRYGVLGDGRLQLGLHERAIASPALTFVLPNLAQAEPGLRAAYAEIEQAQLGDESLNRLQLRDPGGHAVVLLEARTFSPPLGVEPSLCGYFLHLSLPQTDFERAREFWEGAGFVALPEEDLPYPHLPLTSDALDLAFHQRRSFDAPLLVFECQDLARQLTELHQQGVSISNQLPRSMDPGRSALIQSPDDLALLLVQADE